MEGARQPSDRTTKAFLFNLCNGNTVKDLKLCKNILLIVSGLGGKWFVLDFFPLAFLYFS